MSVDANHLPPGPSVSPALQTARWLARPVAFVEDCRRRHGNAFSVRFLGFGRPMVLVADPDVIRAVYAEPANGLPPGRSVALMPVVGPRSVLLLEGVEHLARRRLMLPAFHGDRMRAYAPAVREACEREIARWPAGEPFALHPSMQAITLEVILRAVFGVRDESRLARLRSLLRDLLAQSASAGLQFGVLLARRAGRGDPTAALQATLARIDELLLAEIAEHRAVRADGQDILSLLADARFEDGSAMDDRELRDQLLTLLLAGRRLAVDLDAAGLRLPAGTDVAPSIWLSHTDPERFPDPYAFSPERFPGPPAPGLGLDPLRRRGAPLPGRVVRRAGDPHGAPDRSARADVATCRCETGTPAATQRHVVAEDRDPRRRDAPMSSARRGGPGVMRAKITPNLWFDTEAEEAAAFYVSVFENSRIVGRTHYPENAPRQAGMVMTVEFELDGQRFVAINGGPQFQFDESTTTRSPATDSSSSPRDRTPAGTSSRSRSPRPAWTPSRTSVSASATRCASRWSPRSAPPASMSPGTASNPTARRSSWTSAGSVATWRAQIREEAGRVLVAVVEDGPPIQTDDLNFRTAPVRLSAPRGDRRVVSIITRRDVPRR